MSNGSPRTSISVPAAHGALDGAWRLLLELASDSSTPHWVLIGGLLVEMHAHEHRVPPPRETEDADVLVDVRAHPSGIGAVARWLTERGLSLEDPSADGIGHRFQSADGVTVDLLAPDHLGERANLVTIPPARTIQAIAGTKLIQHAEPVRVHYRDYSEIIHRSHLLATIIAKYRAYTEGSAGATRSHERHLDDAALLLSLVADPRESVLNLSSQDCERMRALALDLHEAHRAWRSIADPSDGQAALQLMARACGS